MPITPETILALDVGSKRIGVARASSIARLANPLVTLANDSELLTHLNRLIKEESVTTIVVGLPRGLDGQETEQTMMIRHFVEGLRSELNDIAFYFQDEALTSRKAESELSAHGKLYSKGDIDALAATYILEDYLASGGKEQAHG